MNWHNPKMKVEIPEGYIPGMSRRENGEKRRTHLYKGSFENMGNPMCSKGWDNEGYYSVFRNNVSKQGVCLSCLKNAKRGLSPVE